MEEFVTVNKKGTPQGITAEGRAMVEAINVDADLANALEHGMAFTAHDNAVTPTGNNDYFAKLANASNYPMVIHRLRILDAGAEVIALKVGANYESATSHAEIEPVNRLVGSLVKASDFGQFESDVDITGQVSATEVQRIKTAANTDYDLDLSTAPIVLLKDQALSLLAVTGGQAIAWSMDFFFQVAAIKDEV